MTSERLQIIAWLSQPINHTPTSRKLLEIYAQLPIENVRTAALEALQGYAEEVVPPPPAVVEEEPVKPAAKKRAPRKKAAASA